MGRFEQCDRIADVRTGRDTDSTNLCRERIRQIVAVEVHRRDDTVLVWPREDLLQHRIRNDVLDDDLA